MSVQYQLPMHGPKCLYGGVGSARGFSNPKANQCSIIRSLCTSDN